MWNSNGNGNHHHAKTATITETTTPEQQRSCCSAALRWQHFHREQRATACRVVSLRSRFATFTAAAFIRLPKSSKTNSSIPHSAHPMHHAPTQQRQQYLREELEITDGGKTLPMRTVHRSNRDSRYTSNSAISNSSREWNDSAQVAAQQQ
jgi:hypothetical protein